MLRNKALCVCEKVNNSDDRQASRRQLAKLMSRDKVTPRAPHKRSSGTGTVIEIVACHTAYHFSPSISHLPLLVRSRPSIDLEMSNLPCELLSFSET